MLVLLPWFIKKKMANSMDKQIAYTDKQDNSPKIPYCTRLTELIEFEVATEPKEEKKKTPSIAGLYCWMPVQIIEALEHISISSILLVYP